MPTLAGVHPAGSEHSRQSECWPQLQARRAVSQVQCAGQKDTVQKAGLEICYIMDLSSPSRKEAIYSSGLRSIQKTRPGRGLETSTHTVQLRLGLKSQGQPETSLMGPGEGPRWDWSPAVKAHWCPQGHDS